MSNRSMIGSAAAAGARGGRPAFAAWVVAVLMVTCAIAPGAVRADTIVLQSGERIEGSIVDATRNTVVIRRAIGGMRQTPIRDIEEVRIDLGQGQSISGKILSWADGVHRIRVGDEVVRIRAGLILSRAPYQEADRQPPRILPPRPRREPTVEMKATPAAPAAEVTAGNFAAEKAAAEKAAAERAAAERAAAERTAAEKAAAERAAAERAAAERAAERAAGKGAAAESAAAREAQGRAETVAVKASVEPAEAGADGLVFRIELSRPAEQTVVLIYGTVDGTAKAGKDYEPRQGIVTLAPGTKSADVHVPLIEQQLRKGDTRFELFLTADPKVAEIVDQRITATIPGDH